MFDWWLALYHRDTFLKNLTVYIRLIVKIMSAILMSWGVEWLLHQWSHIDLIFFRYSHSAHAPPVHAMVALRKSLLKWCSSQADPAALRWLDWVPARLHLFSFMFTNLSKIWLGSFSSVLLKDFPESLNWQAEWAPGWQWSARVVDTCGRPKSSDLRAGSVVQ